MQKQASPTQAARAVLFEALRAVGVPELDAAQGRIPVAKLKDVQWCLAQEVADLRRRLDLQTGRHRR